eukprot:g60219.t1
MSEGVEEKDDDREEVREQDRLLPIANISRIMKTALPPNAKMSKEAKACVQECVSEFIGFITSEAADRLQKDKRKTVTGHDVVDSMRALGFDYYMEYLEQFLSRYREENKGSEKGSSGKRGRKRTNATKGPSKKKVKSFHTASKGEEDEDDFTHPEL